MTVSIKQVRQSLAKLVSAAERGDRIIITRRGREVASLGPVAARQRPRAMPSLADFRASLDVHGESLSQTVLRARQQERF